jgi:bifunctional enzyme CysN/CysC
MADHDQGPDDGFDPLIAADINAYLEAQQHKSLVRVITCGSVDDGKSTLIGRLLYDTRQIFDDQMAALEADSKRVGTQGQEIDFALLVDGLSAEREQGITIDVAYRFFTTPRTKFIIADCPGHEQYTRNMVTGASTADAAIVLVDARKGVLTQTRRHSYLVNLLGIRHVVLAVNKMDLIDFDQARFDAIVSDYRAFAAQIGLVDVAAIPISGLGGDNITAPSSRSPWYSGPALLPWLEQLEIAATADQARPFRLPVQWVNRPNLDFRGFTGLVTSGAINAGDPVRILPSGRTTSVARIVTADGDLPRAVAGQSITLTLADEVDCARGSIIAAADDPPQVADQFDATLVWMSDDAMLPGRSYLMKLASQTVPATLQPPKHAINVNTLEELAARTLDLNAMRRAAISAASSSSTAPPMRRSPPA